MHSVNILQILPFLILLLSFICKISWWLKVYAGSTYLVLQQKAHYGNMITVYQPIFLVFLLYDATF